MDTKDAASIEERVRRGQSAALGDTGDGDTGAPSDEPGISNRPGDTDAAADDDDVDEPDDQDEDDDELTDPAAEPGKPI